MMKMSIYRTLMCGAIRKNHIGQTHKLAGWVETIRDHGGVLFLDLRDETGVSQIVIHDDQMLKGVHKETVVSFEGKIILRDEETYNNSIPTGEVELVAEKIEVLGESKSELPFEISRSTETSEDLRLKYRFLDLRSKEVHDTIIFRSKVVSFLRRKMEDLGFTEITTPILTCSSPEGARDYLVPSRKHKGKFYALPQAPQQFKQLLMTAGFDKYFQIAPCFRDEDARADRSPGEFYQLDFEMAFATQEDVFTVAEEVLYEAFTKFTQKEVSKPPFVRIPYKEAMLKYGTDKPDLRCPLTIIDLTSFFSEVEFKPFKGKPVRGIVTHKCTSMPKSFFEKMLEFALSIGMKGLGYIEVYSKDSLAKKHELAGIEETEEDRSSEIVVDDDTIFKGPIAKYLTEEQRIKLKEEYDLKDEDVIFFISDVFEKTASKFAGQIRIELGKRLDLIDKSKFEFCFITDFPMYEVDEVTGKLDFMHNPFSMPQGGMKSLKEIPPLDILAYQYDIVCDGVELSSGAVRNHRTDIMVEAFKIAGYDEETVKEKFGALYKAFQYGAPPHAGMAPGVDRMIMLLKDLDTIRDVIAFPMTSSGEDLMCGAPSTVTEEQLREVHIKLRA
jgi:aspartyl-tRNA synthetase